ncbi:MAG: AsmA family protein [Rhodospirillaceae bacterium]|nr:AsmA family protein [Rhodospirillaceae bacterium]
MVRRLARWLRWILILVVALVITAVAILLTADPETYRAFLADRASAALGRRVTLDGAFDLQIALSPVITATDVHVANPPGFEPHDMVSIGALEISAGLVPLLGGRVEIDRLLLDDVQVDLIERADGSTNYDDFASGQAMAGDGASGGDDGARLEVSDVRIRNLTVTHTVDGHDPETVAISQAQIHSEGGGAPVTLAADATVNDLPVSLTATLDSLDALMRGAEAGTGMQMDATLGSLALTYDGVLAPQAAEVVDGHLTLDLAEAATGGFGPIAVAGRLVGGTDRLELTSFDGTIAGSEASGDLLLALDRPRPLLGGGVTFDRLALAGSGSAAAGPLIPDLATVDPAVYGIDADLGLSVGELALGDTRLTDVAAELRIAERRSELGVASAQLEGGQVRGVVTLEDGRRATLRGSLDGVNLRGLVNGADGPASALLDFSGEGAGLRELVAAGSGTLSANLGPTVVALNTGDIAGSAVADALTQLLPLGGNSIEVSCAAGEFDIADGQLTSTGLVADTAVASVAGWAVVDLMDETMDVVLRPRARIGAIEVPVRLFGPLADPSVVADMEDVAAALPGSLLGGLRLRGLTVPLVAEDSGTAGCASALNSVGSPLPDLGGVDSLDDLGEAAEDAVGRGLGDVLEDAGGLLGTPDAGGLGNALDGLLGN